MNTKPEVILANEPEIALATQCDVSSILNFPQSLNFHGGDTYGAAESWRITLTPDGRIEFHGFKDMDEAAALFVRRVQQMWSQSHDDARLEERREIVAWLREKMAVKKVIDAIALPAQAIGEMIERGTHLKEKS